MKAIPGDERDDETGDFETKTGEPSSRDPAVTIGIPFISWDSKTELAVASVLAQTFTDWELILYGDGPYSILDSVPEWVSKCEKIRVESSGVNRGLGAALNSIHRAARGWICVRMDSDDVMHSDRCSLLFQAFHVTSAQVVGSRAFLIDDHNRVFGGFREPSLPTGVEGYLRSNAFSHPTVAALRSWFLENPYDESIRRAEDKDLWLRTFKDSSFIKLSDRLLYYRVPQEVNARKFYATARDDRRLLWRYLRGARERRFFALLLIFQSIAKSAAFIAAICLGSAKRMYARRVEDLPLNELEAAKDHLASIAGVQ